MKMIERRVGEVARGAWPSLLGGRAPGRRAMVLAGLCLLGLGVAGCGRRGPPEPPPGALSAPSEQAVQEANPYSGSRYGGVEQSDGGSATIGGVGGPAIGQALDQPNQPVQSKSQGKPKKSFFLDPLL